MSLTTGVAGLPFEWSPSGHHQYADCWVGALSTATSAEIGTAELFVPVGRLAYVVVLDEGGDAGTSDFVFWKKSSTAFDDWVAGAPTTMTIPADRQLGSWDTTSVFKYGLADQTIFGESIPMYGAQFESQGLILPVVIPGGNYLIMQGASANTNFRANLRWLEIIPK